MADARRCKNPYCGETWYAKSRLQFCPSCWFAIKLGFRHGALLIGTIAAVLGYVLGRG